MKPVTQYTKSGSINIAYQVFGSGSVDLVYIPGWVSNIDWMWACPELVAFLTELGKISRVILFDKRGTGLSDRVVELSTIEERMDDIRAVMDAVDSEKAILFGHSEGGSVSALFAATYPNRTISIIAFGIFAKRRYSPDYPWAPTDQERQVVYDMIENSWGSGDMHLESLAPSKANDKMFMDWLANYFRSGASPSAAMVLTKMNTEVNIVNILSSVKVPTLLLQRTNDIDVKIEEGRFIAERIPKAKFVELAGNDHLFWAGNTADVLEEMRAFILNTKPLKSYEGRLFTIVAGRLGASGNIDQYESQIDQLVKQYSGNVIEYQQDRFTAAFEGPSRAVHCSLDLKDTLSLLNATIHFGVQIREGAFDEVFFLGRETKVFIDLMLEPAYPDHILVTQTVKSLLSGTGLTFGVSKTIFEAHSGESFQLFTVKDDSKIEDRHAPLSEHSPRSDSLLESVLQVIDAHIGDEHFSVERLCNELAISERQIQRKLKAITNKSPNQLISSVRLHRAKELILARKYNIGEIAYQTGFSSPSYFSKSFKKEFGTSPSNLQQLQIR